MLGCYCGALRGLNEVRLPALAELHLLPPPRSPCLVDLSVSAIPALKVTRTGVTMSCHGEATSSTIWGRGTGATLSQLVGINRLQTSVLAAARAGES